MLISLQRTPSLESKQLNFSRLPALQIPLQIHRAGHQNHSRHSTAMSLRTFTLQPRQLLVGQPRDVLASFSQGLGAGDGSE